MNSWLSSKLERTSKLQIIMSKNVYTWGINFLGNGVIKCTLKTFCFVLINVEQDKTLKVGEFKYLRESLETNFSEEVSLTAGIYKLRTVAWVHERCLSRNTSFRYTVICPDSLYTRECLTLDR